MIRMNICGGDRLCGVGMLWIGGVLLGSFATALMPLRPFILEAYFDAFAQGRSLQLGEGGIAADIRYAFGTPISCSKRSPMPDAMPQRQHTP